MEEFVCLSISSADLPHPAVALATCRSGGIGILDFEFCADQVRAFDSLRHLRAQAGDVGRTGVRVTAAQLGQCLEGLAVEPGPGWLVVAAGACGRQDLVCALDSVATHQAWNVLVEVTSASQVEWLHGFALAGVIAKGYESGGWVGEDTAFILTHELLALDVANAFVRGGGGL